MSDPAAPNPRRLSAGVDPDLIAALAYCRLGGDSPKGDDPFNRAKDLGLLAQDPCWRCTTRGEGVLIAAGLLDPRPEPEQITVHMLWADHGESYQPTPVAAFSDGLVDMCDERYDYLRREAEESFSAMVDGDHKFFRTVVHLDRPSLADDEDRDEEFAGSGDGR